MTDVLLRTTLTYKEYCLIPEDGKRHELLGGHHHMTPAPTTRHQQVLKRLYAILLSYFEEPGRGQVFFAPTDVILTDQDVVQPDLVVVTALQQISERGIEGPPTLVVEIVSPRTADYDRTVKAQRYAALGVPHYWIADPESRALECFRLESGRYARRAAGRGEEHLTLPEFPGLTIGLGALWPS